MSGVRVSVYILGAVLCVAGVTFLLTQTSAFDGERTTEQLVEELRECIGDKEALVTCGPVIIGELMETRSAMEAMRILASSFSTRECHVVGHVVGQETYRQAGGVEKALSACDASCGGACTHGAIGQAFIAEAGALAESVDLQNLSVDDIRAHGEKLCKNVDTCHGVGHILFQLHNEIDGPLALCAEISTGVIRQSCFTGVFMENADVLSTHNLLLGTLKVQSRDAENLRYPCDAVPKEARHACLRYQPRVQRVTFDERGIATEEERDALRVRTCETFADLKDRTDCFEGLGFSEYTLIESDPERGRKYCERFELPTDRAACFLGMTFWAVNFDQVNESLAFCEDVESEYERNVCYHGVFATLYADGTPRENLGPFCEGHDAARCNAGREAYLADPWPTLYGLKL